jgi:hypothetical protein
MLHASLRKKTGPASRASSRVPREARPGAAALLQRAYGNHTIAGAVQDGLAAPWQPLDLPLRFDMERRLGHDFGAVRVHVDSGAAARVGARAFTFGDDVVFARDAVESRAILAHELTHVAQQRGRLLTMPTRLADASEPAERSADARPAPDALHRTPAGQTTCATGSVTRTDGTVIANPVDVITAAENRATRLLNAAIGDLAYTMGRIRGGAPAAWPTIGDTLASGLRLLGINPDHRAVWTGSGAGTVELVLERYRAVRAILGAGTVFYTCRGEGVLSVGTCRYATGDVCQGGAQASTCGGQLFTALCDPFWAGADQWKARVILHEHFHAQSSVFGHTGRADNIMCYERLAQRLLGVPLRFQRADFCPNP